MTSEKLLDSNHVLVERVEFTSGSLMLWGEIWRPDSEGPFPVVLWNHGSRGRQRGLQAPTTDGPTTLESWLSMGLAVFAPSRRGYDGAQGQTLDEALEGTIDGSPEQDQLMVQRLLTESDDVLAATTYLRTQAWIDPARLVCSGYSFGAIMAALCLARSHHFATGIAFALGAIMWPDYAAVRNLLLTSTEKIIDPIMMIQAENDYSTAPTSALAAVLRRRDVKHRAIIYPSHGEGPDDGHVFCALGGKVWKPDVQDFLAEVGVLRG